MSKVCEKAEALYLKALSIRQKFLGEKHPLTAISLSNLAMLYKLKASMRAELNQP